MDDNEIIKNIQKGDTESFSLLVEKYHRQLLSFISKIVKDPLAVEDIGQDVFLKVFKSLDYFDLEEKTPFSAWLFIIAKNQAITYLRKNHKWKFTSSEGTKVLRSDKSDPSELLIREEEKHALRQCLQQLKQPYKSALIDSLEGRSTKEIAMRNKIMIGTVKSRINRAKKQLFNLMIKRVWSTK